MRNYFLLVYKLFRFNTVLLILQMISFYLPSGLEDFDSIRKEMYRDSDVILICFDIGHPPSLTSVVEKVLSVFFNHKLAMAKHVILFPSIYFFYTLTVGPRDQ